MFEFVPEDEWGQPGARALFADEIEVGGTYQILLTTPAGLYRYAINDVIEVVDMHGGAPLIRFLRKGRDVVNIHGEKVSANQVIAAMAAAATAIGAKVSHFMFVPDAARSLLLPACGVRGRGGRTGPDRPGLRRAIWAR